MSKKKKAAPKCGPSLTGSKITKRNHRNTHQGESTSMMVAQYQVTEVATDYFEGFAPLRIAVDAMLVRVGSLHGKLNRKSVKQLSGRLHKACDSMALGLIADLQVLAHSDAGTFLFGVHRKPTAGDRFTRSMALVGVNRYGQVSEIRYQPSLFSIERMSAAFGMGVPHAH